MPHWKHYSESPITKKATDDSRFLLFETVHLLSFDNSADDVALRQGDAQGVSAG